MSNTRVATRGSQGLQSRGLTAPRTQGSRGTAFTLGSTVMMRMREVPKPLHRSALLLEIPRYLEATGLEENFREVLADLLERPDLPYNPYPGFHRRLRPFAEKFYMDAESREKVEQIIGRPLKETALANLMTMKEGGGVWGLASILPNVCPPVLHNYKWLVDNITPPAGNLYTLPGYSNQAMVAIVGMTALQGSLYAESHNLQLRIEYLVTGPEVKEGVSIFINSVMMDIDAMYNDRTHILIGVNVPYVADDENDVWDTDYFDVERIQMEKAHFLQSLTNAVVGNRFIYAECVFRLDPNQSRFKRGQKQYSLNFIKVVDNEREEGLSTFSEFPMGTLHEGVFLNLTHAEAYISIFTPQMESAELQNIRIASAASEVPPTVGAGKRRFSRAVEHDRLSIL